MPRGQRVEHTYERNGALTYLAAWDVRRGGVIGRCEPKGGIEPFGRLVEQVMTTEPYTSARRVFWIVDNGSSHRGKRFVERLQRQWPTLRLVHTPVHASWLNQIEVYFSIVQREVLTPNDFNDLDEVKERLAGFERLYNEIAEPFAWNFTREKLNSWLARLGKNTYSYIIKGFPRRVIWKHSLSAVELAAAQDACRRAHVTNAALLGGCTVDVGATGDRQLAASAGASSAKLVCSQPRPAADSPDDGRACTAVPTRARSFSTGNSQDQA